MDIRGILRSPGIYIAFQKLVGGRYSRNFCLELLSPKPSERILDIGCGPAHYLKRMPAVRYLGFDTDQDYIQYAKSKFGERGTFFCEEFSTERAQQYGPFDGVLLMGLLHHIDDEACNQLFLQISPLLSQTGRIVTLDTTLYRGQNWIETFLASRDRGDYVRSPQAFLHLAEQTFETVEGRLLTPKWGPSIYWQMLLQQPRL